MAHQPGPAWPAADADPCRRHQARPRRQGQAGARLGRQAGGGGQVRRHARPAALLRVMVRQHRPDDEGGADPHGSQQHRGDDGHVHAHVSRHR